MSTPAQTPTVLRGERSIAYRWEIGPSAESWLGIPGTDVAELQVYHLDHRKQFAAWLHRITVFPNGGTCCPYTPTGPSWSRHEPAAGFSAARMQAFAERVLQQLRATDETELAFAFASAGAT